MRLDGARVGRSVLWHHPSILLNRDPNMPSNHDESHDDEIALLRKEIEMLMAERETLLRTVGAASVFVANLEADTLPESAWNAGDILAESLNDMPEETLREALELVRPLVEKDLANHPE
jgi:hypothetical protein